MASLFAVIEVFPVHTQPADCPRNESRDAVHLGRYPVVPVDVLYYQIQKWTLR